MVRTVALWCMLGAAGNGMQAAQMAGGPASATAPMGEGVLHGDAASRLVPATVFFAGKVASVQARNTGGAKLHNGVVLAGIVDTSGYSSGIQDRYQAYLLLDTPAQFAGRHLEPGAYGCGMVGGQFAVLDLSAKTLFSVPAVHDAALPRPTPLQVLPDPSAGSYRLYLGRNYVVFGPDAMPGVDPNAGPAK